MTTRKADNPEQLSALLDELQVQENEDRLKEIWAEIAEHPFINQILTRLSVLEHQADELARHEHNANGDILIRRG